MVIIEFQRHGRILFISKMKLVLKLVLPKLKVKSILYNVFMHIRFKLLNLFVFTHMYTVLKFIDTDNKRL